MAGRPTDIPADHFDRSHARGPTMSSNRAAVQRQETRSGGNDGAAAPKPRILVVDDVEDNRNILVRRLRLRGFETEEAAGGREALDRIAARPFDIVLLDIMMPDLGGNDVLREVRRQWSAIELPIIMVSAKSQAEDIVQSLELGANDYITKPIEFSVALARIGTQLARKQASDAERNAMSAAIADVAERRQQAEERLHFLAYYDQLTGLLNRAAFREKVSRALGEYKDPGQAPVLLSFDLDGFKRINETFGRDLGDRVLAAIGERLRRLTEGAVAAGRLDGDEFACLLLDRGPEAGLSEAARLVDALSAPFDIDGRQVEVGVSCGVATASAAGAGLDRFIRAADLALYEAMRRGPGTVAPFDPGMLAGEEERQTLEQHRAELDRALRRGEFELFYQPLVGGRSREVVTFEALLRWAHPERGLVGPGEVIPAAEQTGQIIAIGEWALRTACMEAAQWPRDIGVAVNVSPLQFRNPMLLSTVVSALASSGLEPKRLELEITETALLSAERENQSILQALRKLGVRIAIDDFGTGYSSMSFLQNFEVDKIKIDRAFIQGVGRNLSSAAIVESIIDLAARLGVETTAEGVETTDQLRWVAEHGCTQVQGYIFSRPVNATAARLLAEQGGDWRRGDSFAPHA